MIPHTEYRDIINTVDFPGTEMGIAVGSQQFLIYLLRNGIYKYKILSPVREYLVNAQDEHKKFNVKRPIEVTLPTLFEPVLKIRDFAAGLLPAVYDENNELVGGIDYYLGQYGASDKRDSNDTAGFMGLGAKSAFAYTKEFTVVSFKDGQKYTVLFYVDESDKGHTALMDTSDTKEPNGLEIRIPVDEYDIDEFRDIAISLMKYFKIKPVVKGVNTPVTWDTEEALLEGDGWRLIGNSFDSVAIMGEIAYPLYADDMKDLTAWEKKFIEVGIELYFEVGEISMTTNREQLELNKRTLDAIKKRLEAARTAVAGKTEESFTACKSFLEAKSLYYDLILSSSTQYLFKDVVIDAIWNGVKISDNLIDFPGDSATVLLYTYTYGRGGGKVRRSRDIKLTCAKNVAVYLDDTDGKPLMYSRRANTVLNQSGITTVAIVQVKDRKRVLETGLDIDALPSFNAVTPTNLNTSNGVQGTGIDAAKRVKHTRKVFKLSVDKLVTYREDAASDYWDTVTIDDDTPGLFIPIDRFQPESKLLWKRTTKLQHLSDIINNFRTLGVAIPDIYGVKKSDKNTLDEWLVETIKALPDDDVALRMEFISYAQGNYSVCRALGVSVETLPGTHKVVVYHNIREQATKISATTTNAKKVLFSAIGREVKAATRLRDSYKTMLKEYPMLGYALRENSSGKSKARNLLDYIADVDLLNSKRIAKAA